MAERKALPSRQMSEGPHDPHYSNTTEMSVLGGMVLFPETYMGADIKLVAEDFYLPAHQEIFKTAISLMRRTIPVNLVSMRDELSRQGQTKEVGGMEYVLQCTEQSLDEDHLVDSLKLITAWSHERKMVGVSDQLRKMALDPTRPTSAKMEEAEKLLSDLCARQDQRDFTKASDAVKEVMVELDHLLDTGEPILGLQTLFSDLDRQTGGFYDGDLVILAARPSMGKTSLAMQIATNVCRDAGDEIVVVFSCEMSATQLMRRMISVVSGVPLAVMKSKELAGPDYQKILDAQDEILRWPLLIDDTPAISTGQIRAKLRRLSARAKIRLVVVDYLQLLTGPKKYAGSRDQEVGYISRSLKQAARDHKCPVLALSQLNRQVETRQNKRPMMMDIRESGSVEAEADIILFIYRREYYRRKALGEQQSFDDQRCEVAEIIIAKQRNGPTGTVLFGFQPSMTRFTLLDEDSKRAYLDSIKAKRSEKNDD